MAKKKKSILKKIFLWLLVILILAGVGFLKLLHHDVEAYVENLLNQLRLDPDNRYLGALLTAPEGIAAWAAEFRSGSNGSFQVNLWVPDPPPRRDPAAEEGVRRFLADWGPAVPPEAGDVTPPDFDRQCEAFLAAAPPVVSSIMGGTPGRSAT